MRAQQECNRGRRAKQDPEDRAGGVPERKSDRRQSERQRPTVPIFDALYEAKLDLHQSDLPGGLRQGLERADVDVVSPDDARRQQPYDSDNAYGDPHQNPVSRCRQSGHENHMEECNPKFLPVLPMNSGRQSSGVLARHGSIPVITAGMGLVGK
jgi:hypothetical protein